MNVLVDVDSTVADLMPEWLRLYNQDYNDNLTKDQIRAWNMTDFVKEECGLAIYGYLSLSYLYDNVKPIDDACEGVEFIRDCGHRVVFVSAGIYTVAKFKWLQRNGFKPGAYAEDYVVAYDKSLIKGDMLIDDRDSNIQDFGSPLSILFRQPWNWNSTWHNQAFSWQEIMKKFKEL